MAKSVKGKGVKGLNLRTLRNCRIFYITYPQIRQTLSAELKHDQQLSVLPALADDANIRLTVSAKSDEEMVLQPELLLTRLTFSHFIELIRVDDDLQRLFYEVEAIKNNWNIRELRRAIIKASYDANIFSLPASVSFEDGQNEAYIKFSLAKAAMSQAYKLTVELDVDSAQLRKYGSTAALKSQVFGIKRQSVTATKDYAWKDLGTAVFNSDWFAQNGRSLKMQKADGFDLYRAVGIYHASYNMLIQVSGSTATVNKQLIDMLSGVAPTYASGAGTFNGKKFTLTLDFVINYPTANDIYYQELGDVEEIILP